MKIATDVWFAYVVNHIINKCIDMSKEHCQGCKLKWKSAILHEHEQLSLLQKLELYLDPVRGKFLGKGLESLYKIFNKSEPLSTPKKELLDQTKSILLFATPQSLYYGRWMTIEHEIIIQNIFMKRKRNKKKKSEAAEPAQLKPENTNLYNKRKYQDISQTNEHEPCISNNNDLSNDNVKGQQTLEELFWDCID